MLTDLYILTAFDGFTSVCDSAELHREIARRAWASPIHLVRWTLVPVLGATVGEWKRISEAWI